MGCGWVRCGFDYARTSCTMIRLTDVSFILRCCYVIGDCFLHSGSWVLSGLRGTPDVSPFSSALPHSSIPPATTLASSALSTIILRFSARGASAGPGLTTLTALWSFALRLRCGCEAPNPCKNRLGPAKAPDLHRGQGSQACSLSSVPGFTTTSWRHQAPLPARLQDRGPGFSMAFGLRARAEVRTTRHAGHRACTSQAGWPQEGPGASRRHKR